MSNKCLRKPFRILHSKTSLPSSFLHNFWFWTNMYIADRPHSLVLCSRTSFFLPLFFVTFGSGQICTLLIGLVPCLYCKWGLVGIIEGWWILFLLPFSFILVPLRGTLLYIPCIPVGFPWVLFWQIYLLLLLINKRSGPISHVVGVCPPLFDWGLLSFLFPHLKSYFPLCTKFGMFSHRLLKPRSWFHPSNKHAMKHNAYRGKEDGTSQNMITQTNSDKSCKVCLKETNYSLCCKYFMSDVIWKEKTCASLPNAKADISLSCTSADWSISIKGRTAPLCAICTCKNLTASRKNKNQRKEEYEEKEETLAYIWMYIQ